MNVKLMLPLAVVLAQGVTINETQAADKQFTCWVEDSLGNYLPDTSQPKVTSPLQTPVYAVTAADLKSAESNAKATAVKQHGNKVDYVVCEEMIPGNAYKF